MTAVLEYCISELEECFTRLEQSAYGAQALNFPNLRIFTLEVQHHLRLLKEFLLNAKIFCTCAEGKLPDCLGNHTPQLKLPQAQCSSTLSLILR